MANRRFSYRKSGRAGCEVMDEDGKVIAWTMDERWAAVIVSPTNRCFHAEWAEMYDSDTNELN